MIQTMQKSILALAVLTIASLPAMAESVDIRVIGTINPVACTPTIAGGGTIDYGTIRTASISATDYTVLPEKEIDFSIACDAPAKIALKAINGRMNTLAGVTEGANGGGVPPIELFNFSNIAAFGLGLDGTDKIGGYGLRITPGSVQADGAPVDLIYRNSPTTPWMEDLWGSMIHNAVGRETTWAASSSTLIPVPFTTMTGKLGVQAYINKGSELDLTKPIALDGFATIELVYL